MVRSPQISLSSGQCICCTSHDYNPEIGNLPNLLRFEDKFPEAFKLCEEGFIQYMNYVAEVQAGTIVEEVRRRPGKTLIELATDEEGYPILPDAGTDPATNVLDYHKRLIRSFLTAHYGKAV
jgi:hypothetical protein